MNDFLKALGVVSLTVVVVFFFSILSTLGGMIGGWFVGWFFTDLIMGGLARFGVNTAGFEVWQLGGLLGFLGSFFKSYQTNTK